MINERYQVSGVPVDGGERVTGYLKQIPHDGNSQVKTSVVEWYTVDDIGKVYHHSCEINPDTIEPIKAKPQKRWLDGYGDTEYCPNCDATIYHQFFSHCSACGMALDWSE